jgi:hypothetical protein
MTDNSVTCWGANYAGENTPPDGTFVQISAGPDFTCGVKTDGTIACWGNLDSAFPPPTGTFW